MKKNMRKVAALGLCVALGATMLTACGGSKGKSASGGKTELNFGIWDENQRPAMEKMVKAYEKENSDVKINIQLTPYKGGEYWTKLEAAASGGKAPDVFWLNVLHLDSYVEGGILDDLTDKIKDSDIKDSYSETLVNNYVRDKKNFAVPKDFDTNALWYNKEIFDKCGVPYPTDDMSYDDLVATAKALKDSGKLGDGVYPFACPVDFQTWYYQTVYANGGYILSDDKKSTGYDDPKLFFLQHLFCACITTCFWDSIFSGCQSYFFRINICDRNNLHLIRAQFCNFCIGISSSASEACNCNCHLLAHNFYPALSSSFVTSIL